MTKTWLDNMEKKKNFEVWLCDLTYTQQTVASDTMPMAIGCLATYAEKSLPWLRTVQLFKYPEKLCDSLNKENLPDIIGFSNYVWNFRLSYEIAKVISIESPKTVIVFGGPNFPVAPNEQEDFVRTHDVIDFYISKEAEIGLSRLIDAVAFNKGSLDTIKKMEIPSVHCVLADGTYRASTEGPRIKDLTDIPSPYLDGRLDSFFDGSLMPLIQTNRGCPFSCTFCVEGVGYYNKINRYKSNKIEKEIDYIGKHMAAVKNQGGRNDLFIADSNFGMYRDDISTCHQLAKTQEDYGWPEYINVATGKNQKERVLEASQIIKGALRLSGSVQSLDEGVLANIKRKNISANGLMDLALSASEIGANSYSEIILGLPGDSKTSHFKTVRTVIEAGFTNLFLFQLMLLPGSEMSTIESIEEYSMETKYRILPRCYGRYSVFGREIVSAEIEQICVASNRLSFDDYLVCRFMHLIVTIFYNDGIFGSILNFIRASDISAWRWIEILCELEVGGKLQIVFDSFVEATKDELWEDPKRLWKFVQEDGVVERFVGGEIGNNLLFVHKTMAITQCVDDLAELALSATKQLLEENNLSQSENVVFVRDAVKYHRNRMTSVFSNLDDVIDDIFDYDIAAAENDGLNQDLSTYTFEKPKKIRFVLSDEQKSLTSNFLATFGDTEVGIGRILSRVYVKKLFRSAIEHGSTEPFNTTLLTEKTLQITGLQN